MIRFSQFGFNFETLIVHVEVWRCSYAMEMPFYGQARASGRGSDTSTPIEFLLSDFLDSQVGLRPAIFVSGSKPHALWGHFSWRWMKTKLRFAEMLQDGKMLQDSTSSRSHDFLILIKDVP